MVTFFRRLFTQSTNNHGVMEQQNDWSNGVLEKNERTTAFFITNTPALQYSSTPAVQQLVP
jgi:hypothetical protein